MKEPVIIVGAGPVGLALALELSRQGVLIRIFEKDSVSHQENRALLLNAASLQLFEKWGLIKKVLELGMPLYHQEYYSGRECILDLDFSKLKGTFPLFCSLPQKETERLLIEELIKFDVQVERKTKVEKVEQDRNGVQVSIVNDRGKKESLHTPWLLGCDGSKSKIRKLMGSEFKRWGVSRRYFLADTILSWEYSNRACRTFLHPKGSFSIIPIQDSQYRILMDADQIKVKELSPSFFKRQINQRFEGRIEIEEMSWYGEYLRGYRQAESYRNKRLLLVGDAAHVQTPLDGQSLNLGLQDAINLAWKISFVSQFKAKTRLLASYSRERKPQIKRAMKVSNRFLKLAWPLTRLEEQIRDLRLKSYQKIPFLKQSLLEEVSGLKSTYRKSALSLHSFKTLFFIPALKAGDAFKDGLLRNPHTQIEIQARTLLHSSLHQLFIFIKKRHQIKALKLKEELKERYSKIMGIHLISASEELDLKHYWIDSDTRLAKAYHSFYPFYVLIRPDQHIGCIGQNLSKTYIERYFQEYLNVY